MNISLFPLASSVIGLVFALAVLDRFLARRNPHQLTWVIGLFMYFISTGVELWAGMRDINQMNYPLYLFELLGIIIIFIGFLKSQEVFGVYRVLFVHWVRKIPAD